MRGLGLAALLVAAPLLVRGACAQAPAPDTIVAQSGKVQLKASDARRLLDLADPDTRAQAQKDPAVLARLIRAQLLQSVLLEEARTKKFDQLADVAFRAEQARAQAIVSQYVSATAVVPPDYPSDAEVQAAYDANKPRFMIPRQYQIAQIFVVDSTDPAKPAPDDVQRKLKDIRAALARRGADFAAIAKARSEDKSSADKGGDLGLLREDQLIGPVKDAVSGLQDGAVSDPIRAPDGWHILRLVGTRPAAPAPLADIRDQLVRALRQQRQTIAERALVDDLIRRQPIQLDEIQLQRAVQP